MDTDDDQIVVASVYDGDGYTLTSGLQTADVCDEALTVALHLARSQEDDVYLEDSDGRWTVHPDGGVTPGWGWDF